MQTLDNSIHSIRGKHYSEITKKLRRFDKVISFILGAKSTNVISQIRVEDLRSCKQISETRSWISGRFISVHYDSLLRIVIQNSTLSQLNQRSKF